MECCSHPAETNAADGVGENVGDDGGVGVSGGEVRVEVRTVPMRDLIKTQRKCALVCSCSFVAGLTPGMMTRSMSLKISSKFSGS